MGSAATMDDRLSLTPGDVAQVDSYRAAHKVSLLTIMFSDIVGYTELCERHPETFMMRVRAAFDAIALQHVEAEHRGLIVKHIGDAILAVFSEPTAAVSAAVGIHQAIRQSAVGGIALKLRTGLHLGQVAVEQVGTQIDIFGRHVNRAARVQAVAQPDEILVTEPVEDNVRGWMESSPAGSLRFVQRRTHVLKGLDAPEPAARA